MAEQSEVIKALTEAFLVSLVSTTPSGRARARWLVRVMTSLLVFPGHDEADERAMIEEFVLPMVVPAPSRRRDTDPRYCRAIAIRKRSSASM